MGSWVDDVAITVVHEGRSTFFKGVKSSVIFVLDVRFGLYSALPVPAMDWIADSSWAESILPCAEPLESPVYGALVVNFDNRTIEDNTHYSTPFDLHLGWLLAAYDNPEEAPLSPDSLRAHLQHGRIRIMEMADILHENFDAAFVPPADYHGAEIALRQYAQQYARQIPVMTALFSEPEGWTYIEL